MNSTSVLFITAGPDDRASTRKLERLAEGLNGRSGASAGLWYLRRTNVRDAPNGSRVVDDLRTSAPSTVLRRAGLGWVGARVQGARLRWWMRSVRPDVVVLDDGLGARVIANVRPTPKVVVRVNEVHPADEWSEGGVTEPESADLVLLPRGTNSDGANVATEELLLPHEARAARRFSDPAEMTSLRRSLDLPTDRILIAGWGDDGWLDGPDLFIRTLWALEHRHRLRVHGVWFGLTSDRDEARRLQAEAARCGLGDRFHLRAEEPPPANSTSIDARKHRFCADAVFLPYRSPTLPERSPVEGFELMTAACAGLPVVCFEATAAEDPLVHPVPGLDVDKAAETLATQLHAHDRQAHAEQADARFQRLAEAIIELGDTNRAR